MTAPLAPSAAPLPKCPTPPLLVDTLDVQELRGAVLLPGPDLFPGPEPWGHRLLSLAREGTRVSCWGVSAPLKQPLPVCFLP